MRSLQNAKQIPRPLKKPPLVLPQTDHVLQNDAEWVELMMQAAAVVLLLKTHTAHS